MIAYYISKIKEVNGMHLLHRYACASIPEDENDSILLGTFNSCEEALGAALKIYPTSTGCPYCCRSCSK